MSYKRHGASDLPQSTQAARDVLRDFNNFSDTRGAKLSTAMFFYEAFSGHLTLCQIEENSQR
jgi:hypothetical protein